MEIAELIQSIGFPIATALGLGFFAKDFVNQTVKDSHMREEKLIEANQKLSETLQSVADITERASNQLTTLEKRMDNLETKLDEVLN